MTVLRWTALSWCSVQFRKILKMFLQIPKKIWNPKVDKRLILAMNVIFI